MKVLEILKIEQKLTDHKKTNKKTITHILYRYYIPATLEHIFVNKIYKPNLYGFFVCHNQSTAGLNYIE